MGASPGPVKEQPAVFLPPANTQLGGPLISLCFCTHPPSSSRQGWLSLWLETSRKPHRPGVHAPPPCCPVTSIPLSLVHTPQPAASTVPWLARLPLGHHANWPHTLPPDLHPRARLLQPALCREVKVIEARGRADATAQGPEGSALLPTHPSPKAPSRQDRGTHAEPWGWHQGCALHPQPPVWPSGPFPPLPCPAPGTHAAQAVRKQVFLNL